MKDSAEARSAGAKDMLKVAQEAVELGKKATPGPWWQRSVDTPNPPSENATELSDLLCFFDDEGAPRVWDWMGTGALIAHAGTHYATLAAAYVEAVERKRVLERRLEKIERHARKMVNFDGGEGSQITLSAQRATLTLDPPKRKPRKEKKG